jgi:hypothetical protein
VPGRPRARFGSGLRALRLLGRQLAARTLGAFLASVQQNLGLIAVLSQLFTACLPATLALLLRVQGLLGAAAFQLEAGQFVLCILVFWRWTSL